jgi:hypothetical protein
VFGSCHFNVLLVGHWSIFIVCRVAVHRECIWSSHAYISMQWPPLHRTTLPYILLLYFERGTSKVP